MCIPTIIMIMDSTYSHIYSDASILIGGGVRHICLAGMEFCSMEY